MRLAPRWLIVAVVGVAFATVGLPIFQLALRASLGLITLALGAAVALAFTAVAAIVLYMAVRLVIDKIRGW